MVIRLVVKEMNMFKVTEKRIKKIVMNSNIGIITGYRTDLNCAENRDNNIVLRSWLLGKGYGVMSYINTCKTLQGDEFKAQMFLVVDNKDALSLKKELYVLGELFKQETVVYQEVRRKAQMIDIDGGTYSYPENIFGLYKNNDLNFLDRLFIIDECIQDDIYKTYEKSNIFGRLMHCKYVIGAIIK